MGYLIAFYIFSIYMSWKYISISHNKGGRYYGEEIDTDDLIFIFIPIGNSTYWIVSWILYPPKALSNQRKQNRTDKINKFFKIK